jgi:hypothetical protein
LSLLQLIIVFVFRNGSVVEPLIEEGERYMKFE